jgi:dipeptidyl aminopeptidase/acylaminoacyl peptidase
MRTMAWVDRAGREEPIPAPSMAYIYPRISPDGTRVALDIGGTGRDIWVWHFARGVITQISKGPTEDLMPAWTPDGARVYYGSNRAGGTFRIFSVDADGAGAEREEFAGPVSYMPLQMRTRDALLAFASGTGSPQDVVVLSLADRQARTLVGGAENQGVAEVSPDGRLIAYGEDGAPKVNPEVIVRTYPDVDRRREQISLDGGIQPLWGPAGSNELFYWTLNGRLKVVSVTSNPDLRVGTARDVPLSAGYETPIAGTSWVYAVSPVDGRFLLFKRVPGTGALAPIKVVVNWQEELKRLVPTR